MTEQATAPEEIQKEPMSSEEWGKIYAMRNGQLVLLYSLDDDGLEKVRADSRTTFDRPLDKNLKYKPRGTQYSTTIECWGEFVEYAVRAGLDLTGLALSPRQKRHLFEYELQKRDLSNAKFDNAVLDGMDLSGTNLSGASLREARLTNMKGHTPNFSSTKAYSLDLSGSSFTEPNFSDMSAPRSTHFRCTYELPTFWNTDWNSSHMVGTRFFIGTRFFFKSSSYGNWDVSSALMAACLFYGMDSEAISSGLKFSNAAFPGSCFHNLKIGANEREGLKGDFSPLYLEDTRLTPEEKTYVAGLGQWLDSPLAMDGVKVSPELVVELDNKRIHSMFSETIFDESSAPYSTKKPLFFSKGKVMSRADFHTCSAADLVDILPKGLADRLRETNAPVITEKPAEKPTPANDNRPFKIPDITFDKDQVTLQVQALKTASITDTVAIGSNLEAGLTDATRLVSEWGLSNLDTKPLKGTLDNLAAKIKACALKDPAVLEAMAEFPTPTKKENFFKWLFLTEVEDLGKGRKAIPKPLPALQNNFNEAALTVKEFPNNINRAIQDNTVHLSDAERLHKFLQTLQDAFNSYITALNGQMEDIKKDNAAVSYALTVRKGNLESSRDMVAKLNTGVTNLVAAMANDSLAYQWLQSMTVPALNTQFTKASGLHDLMLALEKDPIPPRGPLAGFYSAIVNPADAAPPMDQIRNAFKQAHAEMLTSLNDVQKSLEQSQQQRTGVLKSVLGLTQEKA